MTFVNAVFDLVTRGFVGAHGQNTQKDRKPENKDIPDTGRRNVHCTAKPKRSNSSAVSGINGKAPLLAQLRYTPGTPWIRLAIHRRSLTRQS
jgi:hypothetical protein